MNIVNRTALEGCLEIIPDVFTDHRGISIKPYNTEMLGNIGITHGFSEDLMVTSRKGVIRGLHFQNPPYEQAKLVWCIKGSIFDVAVDIRKDSPTFGMYTYFYLTAEKHNIAYIPIGFAHGYQVLKHDTTVYYKMSSVYAPNYEGGIRFDSLNIPWPLGNPVLSEKDLNLKPFGSSNSAV